MSNKIIRDSVVQGAIVSREWIEANAIESINVNKLFNFVYDSALTLAECTPGYTLPDDTSTEIYRVKKISETSSTGEGGEPIDAYTKAESDAKYAVIEHIHDIADVTGLQTELDTKASTDIATTTTNGLMSSADKTKLDGLTGGGGGGASTTDQITTLGMTEIPDATPLNTVLDDHEQRLDNHDYYVNVSLPLDSAYDPLVPNLRVIQKGYNVNLFSSAVLAFGITPPPDTTIATIAPQQRPEFSINVFAVSPDGREKAWLYIDMNGPIKWTQHTLDGVDVAPGSASQNLYFYLSYVVNNTPPAALSKPAPKIEETTEKTTLIDKGVSLWKSLMR